MMMYRRDYLCKKTKDTQDRKIYREYKNLRNQIVSEIRHAKSSFYSNEIRKSRDSKTMWKTIRTLLHNKKMIHPLTMCRLRFLTIIFRP